MNLISKIYPPAEVIGVRYNLAWWSGDILKCGVSLCILYISTFFFDSCLTIESYFSWLLVESSHSTCVLYSLGKSIDLAFCQFCQSTTTWKHSPLAAFCESQKTRATADCKVRAADQEAKKCRARQIIVGLCSGQRDTKNICNIHLSTPTCRYVKILWTVIAVGLTAADMCKPWLAPPWWLCMKHNAQTRMVFLVRASHNLQ